MPTDILNKACCLYLAKFPSLSLNDNDLAHLNKSERDKYRQIITLLQYYQQAGNYNEKVDYKRTYQKLHELAESLSLYSNDLAPGNLKSFHHAFFIALFENDNQIHSEINRLIIQPHSDNSTSDKQRILQNKAKYSKAPFAGISHPEHVVNRFFSGLLGIHFHPLKKNNVPYISFEHASKERKNLRFGTQINGAGTVNRSFVQYLAAKKSLSPAKKYIHVYINLQKRDLNEGHRFERYFERTKSLALENLENQDLGIAVLTLPADSRYFFGGFSPKTALASSTQTTDLQDMKDEIISAIQNNTHDFYISDEVKDVLFKNKLSPIITELFERAAKDILGDQYSPNKIVDPTIRQAVLFHFVKFHLTDYIINRLHPDNYNISCKDNIDRGGAHNLWYELNLKIRDSDEPISLSTFQKNLDSAALLVKERPMNDHRNLIWNTLYQQFIYNPQKVSQRMPWAGDWLAQNIPIYKGLEEQQHKPANKITISHDLKRKFAARLGKKVDRVSAHEVLDLMNKDINQRLNNIHKAQMEIAKEPVVLTTTSLQKWIDPKTIIKALEKSFVGKKMAVREVSSIQNRQQYIVEQMASGDEAKLPPIHISHTKQQNQDRYRTALMFNPQNINTQQFRSGVKALAEIALAHSKTNPGKSFTITAKGNPLFAIALLTELQKYHLNGKLKDNEFTYREQQAILAEVAKALPKALRKTSMTNLYSPENKLPRKPRSHSMQDAPASRPKPSK
jgi:hypothetical protein